MKKALGPRFVLSLYFSARVLFAQAGGQVLAALQDPCVTPSRRHRVPRSDCRRNHDAKGIKAYDAKPREAGILQCPLRWSRQPAIAFP